MPKMLPLACVIVTLAVANVALADGIGMQFGVPALTSATQAVDLPHFLYVPVIGPWLDIGRLGLAQGNLVFDGLCQDLVGVAFVVGMFATRRTEHLIAWSVLPWFPQSGGGGLSLKATF
jgi:hypothetical protein